jgi:predicted TIM-barrel fold metal-dependent hydrolase
MQRVLALAGVLALVAGFAAPSRAQMVPFVDAHAHLNDPALQLELMDRHGATHAVVFWGGRSDNASVARAAREHAPRLIPFASISPERTAYRPAWQADDITLLAQLEALLATGQYKGIGEISAAHFPAAGFAETDFPLAGALTDGIFVLAARYRVPVMLHVEITRMAELSALLQRHPDVKVIWAHGGYTPLFLAKRMLERHPNLWYELSARTWPRHPRSPEYTVLRDGAAVWPEWLAFVESQPLRFLVGTDASGRSRESDGMKFESVQNFLRQLSPSTRERVGSRNLLDLVGL